MIEAIGTIESILGARTRKLRKPTVNLDKVVLHSIDHVPLAEIN